MDDWKLKARAVVKLEIKRDMFVSFLSVQCNTLHVTEYKITCGVCVCVCLCVRTGLLGRISRKR